MEQDTHTSDEFHECVVTENPVVFEIIVVGCAAGVGFCGHV
jgi:hypothetical protein